MKRQPRDFTYASYAATLEQFKERGYEFRRFDDAEAGLAANSPFVLLRHDIDMCLEAAVRMAGLDAAAGIQATYFFLLRTDHYNVFSRAGTDAVRRILNYGHALGLHFDCAAYASGSSTKTLADACGHEAELLERHFGARVSVVSYHRPDARVLEGGPELSAPRRHTYEQLFRDRISYLSDSRGRWASGHPLASAAFAEGRPLHLLIHPVWWGARAGTPIGRLRDVRRQKIRDLDQSLADNCTVYPRRPSPVGR